VIASLLGVRPDEVDRVRGLVGASFLLGMALVLFYGSANAIFLTRYDITVLPWVYIVNAVVVIAVGLGYGAWSARVSVATALAGLAVMMTVSVTLLWAWATLSDDGAVAFVMATWFRLLFIFAVLGLWEIASAVFDIRQAKRLFAAVALGMMLAFVVGGVATPVLSSMIGTVNLVGVAAACFALYTVDFRRLLRRHRIGQRHATTAAPAGPREILADRYSRRMVWMKYVTILLLYVSEYVFYEQAATTFDTEASLAGFLGLFMGAMTIVMVLVTGLVSGRFISHFGIRAATLALPVGMVIVAVPAGLYGSVVGIDTVFFALVCVVLATDHVVGNAIGEPAGAVLFQPMPAIRRMRVRLAVDGWLGSVALAFAGVLLLVFNALDLDTVAPFLFLVAVIAAAGVLVAVLQYRDYVRALRTITTLAFADDGDAANAADDVSLDALDVEHLADALASDDPGSVVATVAMMRTLQADPLRPLMPVLVEHPDPEVVALALASITEGRDPAHAGLAEALVDRTDLPDATRAAALMTLASLDVARGRARASAILSGPAPAVAVGAALRDLSLRATGLERLSSLAAGDIADRVAACRAIGASDATVDDDIAPVLDSLIRDHDSEVVDAALDAAARCGCPHVAEAAARWLTSPEHRRRAVRALEAAGPGALGAVDDVVAHLPDEVVADVVRHVIGPHGDTAALRRCFLSGARPSVIRRAAYEAVPAGASVRDELAMDLALATSVTAAHRDVAPDAPVVGDALGEELELARRSIYAALGVEYGIRRLRDIEVLVRAGDDDDRANAIEALDVMLAPDHRRCVIAMLEPVGIADAIASLPDLPPARPAGEWVDELRDDPRLTAWTRLVVDDLDHRTDGDRLMDPTISRVLSLRRIEIFSTLSSESLLELARLVRVESAPAGTVIIAVGAPGDELYAITDGSVEVTTSRGRVSRVQAGGVVGELAILDPAPRSATVVALTPVELLVVTRATVVALADRRPEVMAEIARVLARRLRDAT
jgi:hypothetical protein